MVKPDGSKFASTYFHHNILKIFSSTGETLKAIKVRDPHLEKISTDNEADFLYRVAGWASDTHLYFQGINTTSDLFYENPDSTYTHLEIWDWEGQPLYRANY